MAKKSFVTKSGDTWEWEETPEVKKALAAYEKLVARHKAQGIT
jgi:hypothetical protein